LKVTPPPESDPSRAGSRWNTTARPIGSWRRGDFRGRPIGRSPATNGRWLLRSGAEQTYGLVVDRFLGERELVVQPLDPRLGKIRISAPGH
jgi:hypothetical protein